MDSGSLRLPHFGDCTHEGQPFSHGHSPMRRCASSTSASKARIAAPRDADAARVAVVDEDRRAARLRVVVRRQAADVPAVAHGQEREHGDLRVLGRVERAEELVERQLGGDDRLGQLVPQRLGGERGRRQVERDEVEHLVVREAARLVRDTCSVTTTVPKESVTPSSSRRSSRRSMYMSVSRLACVYQSPSNGRTNARRYWRSSSRDLVRAAAVQVHRAVVGRVVGARRVDRADQLARGDVDDREPVAAGGAQRDRAGRVLAAVARDPHAVRPAAQRARRLEPLARERERRAEELGVGRLDRALVRRAQHVRGVDLLVLGVQDRRLHRAIEELVRMAAEELVQRVLARDVHREAAAATARAAPHLAQRGDRAGERHADRRVERADVDAELERVGGDDAQQLAVDEPALQLAPLLRRVAGAVGRDPVGELRGARRPRARAGRSAPSARPPCATS